MADAGGTGGDRDREEFAYDPEEVTEDGPEPETEAEATDDEERFWRFDLDEVNEEGMVRRTIEAGDPKPENALFVVLGALATVLVFVHLWLLVT